MSLNSTQEPALKKITILQHSPLVKPLALYALLKKMHFDINLCSFNPQLHSQGWTLPTEKTALILLGGPQSVYEQKQHPWLIDEFNFINDIIDAAYPALGICLGGQILSSLLGAEVKPCAAPEIGWHSIKVLSSAKCLELEESEINFFQWHFDSFEIPKNSQVLFEGKDSCKNQGYLWNDQVLSVQFHPEMTYEGAALLKEKYLVPEESKLLRSSCLKTDFENNGGKAHSVLEKMLLWLRNRCC